MRAPVVVKRSPVAASRGGAARRQKLAFETDRAPDPLKGMEAAPTDLEAQQKEIVAKVTEAYRNTEKQQRQNYKEANSTAYYRVLVFNTVEQAEAFMCAAGQDISMQVVDGRAVADKLGIELPKTEWKPKASNPNGRFAKHALPLK